MEHAREVPTCAIEQAAAVLDALVHQLRLLHPPTGSPRIRQYANELAGIRRELMPEDGPGGQRSLALHWWNALNVSFSHGTPAPQYLTEPPAAR